MGNLRADSSKSVFFSSRVRKYALATAGATALCLMAGAAVAQETAQADSSSVEAVSVTGTRVQRDGYSAPTPVTVVGAEQIEAQAPQNLADFVNKLPSFIGSETPNTSAGSLSNGLAGINALNLRSLGVNRTLILLNGHRTPASAVTGDTDINTIPQQLVKRVDVVTGGASADYGSDAVGGVVNFILDTQYTGLKGGVEYGETDAGLQPAYKVSGTYGTDFDGGRGHFIVSGDWDQIKVTPKDYAAPWNQSGYFKVINPAYTSTNGLPYYLIQSGIGASQVAPGGLVISSTTTAGKTSTALGGTYFGLGGTVNNLNYGATTGPWMIGGDTAVTQANYGNTSSLAAGEVREDIYSRLSYQVFPDVEAWAEGSISRYKGFSIYQQPPTVGGITIKADNAFLPASIKTAMAAQGLSSLNLGSTNSGFPESGSLNGREAWRFAGGFDGTYNLLNTDWKWDLSGQIGWVDTREQETPVYNNARIALAQDAVVAPAGNAAGIAAGTIVCRDTLTNPGDGCSPLSRIGVNGGLQDPASFQKGLNYVLGTPFRTERLSEQDYSFNVSGAPFEDWAGPVSVAFGGEWRLESVNGFVPSQYNSGWLFGNYLVNKGHYSVGEGYFETVAPLLKGLPMVQELDFNGAYRYTAYSTSGGVSTWKAGLTWQVVDQVKFRTTYSHDIRAPNLNDLFASGTARTNTVNVVTNNATGASSSVTFVQNQTGNVNLAPESANSLGAGVVLTPDFIPGLTVSTDYYNITISGAIGTITAQNTADLCFIKGIQQYCNNIAYTDGSVATPVYNGKPINTILLVPFNFSKQKDEGIDFDVTYPLPLDDMAWFGRIPGDFIIHGLATHYIRNYTNDGVNPPADLAGVNAGSGTPDWVYRVDFTYHTDPWTFDVLARGVSAGIYSNLNTECTSGCPVYTLATPSVNNNKIAGAFYMDLSTTYDFSAYGADSQLFLSMKNIFNTNPPLVASGPDGNNIPAYPQTNRALYDYLGRVYRIGLRLKM
jgi:outer membrane receptor protein involved in Fe transport